MNRQNIVERIIELNNQGKKTEALNLLKLSSWSLKDITNEYLKDRICGKRDKKGEEICKEECDRIGGRVFNSHGELIYEKDPTKIKKGNG